MNMATLYQIGDDGSRGEQWELSTQPVIVGRGGQAQVSIRDEGLSRRHFCIVRDGEDYVIKDLNSRNGTWVDGRRVLAEKLRHNNLILAGNTRFLFAASPAASATVSRASTGPNGTVVVPAAPDRDHKYAPIAA